VAANFEESLRQRAREASIRMCVAGDPEFALSPVEGERIADKLVELFERNPRSLPACRAGQLFTQGNADMVDRGEITDGMPSKKLLKTLRSGFGDYMHLTGAAYCDVATCLDPFSKASKTLVGARGFEPPTPTVSTAASGHTQPLFSSEIVALTG
jgi:hypothetical protein